MVCECDQCDAPLPPGATACPRCGEAFEDAVPADADLPEQDLGAAASPAEPEPTIPAAPLTGTPAVAGDGPYGAAPPSSQPLPRTSPKTPLLVGAAVLLVPVLGFAIVHGVLTHRSAPVPAASALVSPAPVPPAAPAPTPAAPEPSPPPTLPAASPPVNPAPQPSSTIAPGGQKPPADPAFAALKAQTIAQIRLLQASGEATPPGSPSKPPFPYRVDAHDQIYHLEPNGTWRAVSDEELRRPVTPQERQQIEATQPRIQGQP